MTHVVSAIVCVYDTERYVAETIEHLLAQTRPCDEVVVVDDGSRDASVSVVERYLPAVRLVRQEHAGISAARNTGIRSATGDLIAFCDSDDLWEPTKLEKQLAVFTADPTVDVVFTAVHEFVSPEVDPDEVPLRTAHERSTGPLTSTMLARRDVFDRAGPFDESREVGDWLEWYLRLHDCGVEQVRLPEALVHRRLHGNNNSMRGARSRTEYLHAMKAHIDRQRSER